MPTDDRSPIAFGPCYATLADNELIIGNAYVERRWRVRNGLLYPTSFRDLTTGHEWLAAPSEQPAPVPAGTLPEEAGTLSLSGRGGRHSPVAEPSLQVELTATGDTLRLRYRFEVFPTARGVLVQLGVEGPDALTAAPKDAATPPAIPSPPTGVERVKEQDTGSLPPPPLSDVLDCLRLSPQHLRLTQVILHDQTDRHNELVFENEWLLHPSEAALFLQGNLFNVEDTLTRAGLIFVKQAPLPHARPVPSPHDLWVQPRERVVRFVGHGAAGSDDDSYPFVVLAYTGGAFGRTEALHTYQRALRAYVPDRDGMLLSNTWGDRSQDGRVNHAFLRQEVAAAAKLGVDVVQIDDGWQRGRTANSVNKGGVWEGFYQADPDFWTPHPQRFPKGLAPLVEDAKEQGLRFGLWFAPDSTDDFARWEQDAATILHLHRTLSIHYFKIDGVKLRTKRGERNLRRFYDRVLAESAGRVVFDHDVTAEVRPGYFGCIDVGPIFVENRYTDWHRYWPHATLRNLWKLARYIEPLRLRMEFLNHARNVPLYADDALAPAAYSPAYLFATVMFASPLGWFEASHLPDTYKNEAASLVRVWKAHRQEIFSGCIFPIGEAPDGTAWTGFVSVAADRSSAYALLFRERNDRVHGFLDMPLLSDAGEREVEILAGDGSLSLPENGRLTATIPDRQGFLFARITVSRREDADEGFQERQG